MYSESKVLLQGMPKIKANQLTTVARRPAEKSNELIESNEQMDNDM